MFIIRFITFALVHSLLASTRMKQAIFRLAGKELPAYRLFYNLLALVMFGWVMSAYRHSPVLYFVPGVWSLVMYLLQLATIALLFRALQQTGAGNFSGFRQLRTEPAPEQLIVTGFYSIVRHPLYLLSSLFLVLNPVMTVQWMLLTILSILYFLLGAYIEEQRLKEFFGRQYRDYSQKVPFIIPGRPAVKSAPNRGANNAG